MGQTGNKILTDDAIAKGALVRLKNTLKVAGMVNRVYEQQFAKQFDTVNIRLPIRTKSASGNTFKKQPMVQRTIPFKIEYQEHFGASFSARDRTLTPLDKFLDDFCQSGIDQLANAVDRSILIEMKKKLFTSYGTPGTAPTFASFHYMKAVQNDLAVPQDSFRRGVMSSWDAATFATEAMGKYNEAMVKDAISKGFDGSVAGYNWKESQNIPTHTVGAHGGTPLVNGANQNGEYLVTDGWTGGVTGLLKAGDIIHLSTIKEINPVNYQPVPSGRTARFIVLEDVNSDSSGNATIHVWPPINDGVNVTTTNGEGETIEMGMYQNISGPIPNNEPITVEGTASTTYRLDFLFHRDAVTLACVDLDIPEEFTTRSVVRDPQSGLAMSMCGWADGNELEAYKRFDVVWGVKAIYPELGARMWSGAASA